METNRLESLLPLLTIILTVGTFQSSCVDEEDEEATLTIVNKNEMTEYVNKIVIRDVVDGSPAGNVVVDEKNIALGGSREYPLDLGVYYVHIKSGPPLEGFWFTTSDNYLNIGPGEAWVIEYGASGGHIIAP